MRVWIKHVLMTVLMVVWLSGCESDIGVTMKQDVYQVQPDGRVVIDSIVEPEQLEALDLLVVLDRSCSMNDDAPKLGVTLSRLAADMSSLTTDFQIGFISADGRCGPDTFVGPFDSTSLSIDIMMAPTSLSAACALEEGFSAVYQHITQNDVFRRPGVPLVTLFVTDEEEQSSPEIPVDVFKQWLDSVVAPAQVYPVAITTLDEQNCSSTDVGQRYIDLVKLYGKKPIDICASDWETWTSSNSLLATLTDIIELSETPVEDSIVVYLNEKTTTAWTYDSGTESVIMNDMPTYGDVVTVGYRTLD